LRARFLIALEQLHAKHPSRKWTGSPHAYEVIHTAPESLSSPTSEDARLGRLERKHWQREREPLWKAVRAAEDGDLDAYKRIEKTRRLDFQERFRIGSMPRVKENPRHAELFLMGMELGLEKLTDKELADCFDELCDCGEVHDPDALKKQRYRLRKAIRAALNSSRPK
jgi:hypothetical protein